MRLMSVVTAACVLACAAPAAAQAWDEFTSREDGFHVNFPGQPKVMQTTYTSEDRADLPARV